MKIFIMKRMILIFLMAVGPFLMINCNNDDDSGLPAGAANRLTLAVIVAGYEYDAAANSGAGADQACYWVNGAKVDLGDGTNASWAKALFVSGNNIYIAGYYMDVSSNYIACYWINDANTKTDLEVAAIVYSGAESIFVSGSNVYVAGYAGSPTRACYWLNGTRTYLDIATSFAYSIFVSDAGVVYIAGMCSASQVCYWVDSVQTWTTPSIEGYGYGAFVSGSDFYLVGYNSAAFEAGYWLNGTAQTLGGTLTSSSANSVFVDGANVYIAGNYNTGISQACYWLNGTQVLLGDGTNASYGNSIYFFENYIYTAGYQTETGVDRACYWVGTTINYLNSDTGIVGHAYAIWDPYMDLDFDLEKFMAKINK